MRRTRLLALGVLAAGLGTAAGCGEKSNYVTVSGVVRLNNKPYPNAIVLFQPVGGSDNQNPGRGSSGVTDADGRFRLKCDDGRDGAVVGLHQVKIRTNADVVGYDPEVGSPDNTPAPKKGEVDPIPIDWRTLGEKHTFEVPPGGTDQANFNLDNPRYKN
ncbi:MAG: DUF4198 domain-containing protein [Gemmataceae bacterium]|nr:DUF4198 domain-containing protein [Gemmataceae bacterium]